MKPAVSIKREGGEVFGFGKKDQAAAQREKELKHQGLFFYAPNREALNQMAFQVRQEFQAYLQSHSEAERQAAYERALQSLRGYRDFCHEGGENGRAFFEWKLARAAAGAKGSKGSFGYALAVMHQDL